MLVLGIESTCDETGVALVASGRTILSNRVISQVPLHERFGGVVPEIASRAHVEVMTRLIDATLEEAGVSRPQEKGDPPPIDLIAVAHRPGLIGSLLVGVTAAKSLALAWGVPLVGVDHVHAHIYSATMTAEASARGDVFPAVALVVSGGHTALYRSRSWSEHELLGTTTDDAVGEAFDKVAAILGLGYPGGPAISRAAKDGNPASHRFPRTLLERDSLDFSFSGIKTAVLYHAKGQDSARSAPLRPGVRVADVAASFQEAAVETLVVKLERALRREPVERAIVAGGVAANECLRAQLRELAVRRSVELLLPPRELCTDNAAMIAGLGYHLRQAGRQDDLSLEAHPMMTR